jgi:arylsulfatase A-like enzyme
VVVLVMDTCRADRCSFDGYARPTTPRLDAFANDATVFLDAWSPAGWTGPAHATLFTGLRVEHHGFHAGNRHWLRDDVPTLAELLGRAGYATACFSNNEIVSPAFGLTRGFDKVELLCDRHPDRYPWAAETHENACAWATAQAQAGKPFFLFVNDVEPHMPYVPPEEDQARFVRGAPTSEELATARRFDFADALRYSLHTAEESPRSLELLSDLYDAEIAALDREIGVLLDRLCTAGLLEDAVVVVTSDHGEFLGEHHRLEHGNSLLRPLRRVPLIVRAKGWFDGGRRVSSVVRLEDILPTLCQLCGVVRPNPIDGASLCSNLEGRLSRGFDGAKDSARERLKALVPDVTPPPVRTMSAIYDGRWHSLEYGDGELELFDLATDPGEETNLARTHPAELARLSKLLHAR